MIMVQTGVDSILVPCEFFIVFETTTAEAALVFCGMTLIVVYSPGLSRKECLVISGVLLSK